MAAGGPSVTTDLTFADYGAVLRRRGWIIIALLVIGFLVGLGVAAGVAKSFKATTVVQVQDTSAATNSGTSSTSKTVDGVNLDTEAQVVRSAQVATAAAKSLGLSTPAAKLQKDIAVSVPANSTVLNITFTGSSPSAAQSGSLAFAQAYLAQRHATAAAALAAQRTALVNEITPLTTQLRSVTTQVATLPDASSARALAEAQQGLLVSQINGLNAQLAPLASISTVGGAVITSPQRPTAPSSPSKPLYAGGGALVGLLLGFLIMAGLEILDPRLRGRRGAERLLQVPVLAELDIRPDERWASVVKPTSPAARGFGELCDALAGSEGGHRTILVVGVDEDGPGSIVAAGLAAAISRARGEALLLVTAERDPGLAALGVKLGDDAPDGVQSGTAPTVPGLRVGHIKAVGASRGPVVMSARTTADTAVIAGPAIGAGALDHALVEQVDAVILVARDGSTSWELALTALRRLRNAQAHVAGVVLLPPAPRGRRRSAAVQDLPAIRPAQRNVSTTVVDPALGPVEITPDTETGEVIPDTEPVDDMSPEDVELPDELDELDEDVPSAKS